MVRQCDVCNKNYASAKSLKVHRKGVHNIITVPQIPTYHCNDCEFQGFGLEQIVHHFQQEHGSVQVSPCIYCMKTFGSRELLFHHIANHHGLPVPANDYPIGAKASETAFNGAVKTYTFYPEEKIMDPVNFMMTKEDEVRRTIEAITRKKAHKIQFIIPLSLVKPTADEGTERITYYSATPFFKVYSEGLDEKDYMEAAEKLMDNLVTFVCNGSGWVVEDINSLIIKCVQFSPLRAASYIALPAELQDATEILNIRNYEDYNCFSYCYTAAYHSRYGPELLCTWRTKTSPTLYSSTNPLAHQPTGRFDWPMPLREINRFEALNTVAVNVFQWIDKELVPLRVSKADHQFKLDLLLLSDENVHHYALITSLERFVCRIRKVKRPYQRTICRNCLHLFRRSDLYARHKALCGENDPMHIEMPKPGAVVEFKNVMARWFSPVVIYFDLESLLIPTSGPSGNPELAHTKVLEKHVPCGYGLTVIEHNNPKPVFVKVLRAENCMIDFVQTVEKLAVDIYERKRMFSYKFPAPTIPKELVEDCWICGNVFVSNEEKVLDHCHYTGDFLGWAHSKCNLTRRTQNFVPVIAHNLQNYDLHHVCLALKSARSSARFSIIPSTDEKYISFTLSVFIKSYTDKNGRLVSAYENLRFIDSFKFMLGSLDKLTSYLNPTDFSFIDEHFSNYDENTRLLLKRKGFYPYNYFNAFEKFEETSLPPLKEWKNSLTGDISINENELEHAKRVYSEFRCGNLGDYHNLYLTTDVLLLANVFEKFRDICYETYGLDSAQYYGASNLAGDAFLRVCRQPVGLLSEREHLDMAEDLLRGGISCVYSSRKFIANNKYLASFNSHSNSTFGLMVDANNLYGGIMEHFPLPLDGFHFNYDISINTILNTPRDSKTGFIVEVDLSYPDSLHDDHADFPLAPEKLAVNPCWLSDYQKTLLGPKKLPKNKKLLQTLYKKTNYTLHYLTLQLYVKLGMIVERMHRVLEFNQEKWLAPYIQLNTEKRKASTNKFEENFFKLMSNSAYGKCCENKRKRNKVKLVRNLSELLRTTDKELIKSCKIFDEELVAFTLRQTRVKMNKPILVGAVILDLAKLFMYDFHYNTMKQNFACKLLYSDTDSLVYSIRHDDIYSSLMEAPLNSYFDFSNYPTDHPLFDNSNKLTTLKFKDELKGEILVEFVGLKSKMYSITTEKSLKQSAKGISRNAQKKLTHQKYTETLRRNRFERFPNYRITSVGHQLFTVATNKQGLSNFDDKRFICQDGIQTLPYGHFSIRENVFIESILMESDWGTSTPPISTIQAPIFSPLSFEPWLTPDPGFNQSPQNDSDFSSVDWDRDSDTSTPPPNPFLLTEAVESDSESPQPPKRKRNRTDRN